MKILQLTPQFPFPANDGGKIGISNIYYSFLELGCDVEMISISNKKVSNIEIENYKGNGKIHVIYKDTHNSKLKILKYFLLSKTLYIEKHYSNTLMNNITSLVNINTFDIIHVDHSNMARIGLELAQKFKIPIGLRLHNIEYMIWKRYFNGLSKYDLRKVFIGQQFSLLRQQESNFIDKVDISFAITNKDKEKAIEISPNANIKIASAGVDIDSWVPDKQIKKTPNSLVIATTFNWIHNVNALLWFLENVQPRLKQNFDNLTLSIIGKNPPYKFKNYDSIGVNTLGYVDDVKPFLNKSEIYIAPLFVGSGIRIKILEAMAMGLPVVATDISAEGIQADESSGLFRANTIEGYVNTITNLLGDSNKRKVLSEKSRDFIIENHTWKKNVGIMVTEYQKLVFSKNNKA